MERQQEQTMIGGVLPFPWKLHQMLDEAEQRGFDEIVSWLSSGTMFCVHNKSEFITYVAPQYFNQKHYKSFQRQLNIYGFQRISKGIHKGAYFHSFFARGKPDLCRYVVRISGKQRGINGPLTVCHPIEAEEKPNVTMAEAKEFLRDCFQREQASKQSIQDWKSAGQTLGTKYFLGDVTLVGSFQERATQLDPTSFQGERFCPIQEHSCWIISPILNEDNFESRRPPCTECLPLDPDENHNHVFKRGNKGWRMQPNRFQISEGLYLHLCIRHTFMQTHSYLPYIRESL